MIATASARFVAAINRSSFAKDDSGRALATPGAPSGSEGVGTPAFRRTPVVLIAVVISILGFALSAATASAEPPEVKLNGVSDVSYDSAVAAVEINGHGFAGYTIDVSTDGGTSWTPVRGEVISSEEFTPVSVEFRGLQGGTTYLARVTATNYSDPEVHSSPPDPEFTTLPVDPGSVVSINNAAEVGYAVAKASGKVKRPEGNVHGAFDLNCRFEYVTDDQYTATGFDEATPVGCQPENPVSTQGESTVTAELAGLAYSTTYHLRLKVSNAGGSDSKEAASTFTTLSGPTAPPSVTFEPIIDFTGTDAHFSGTVDPDAPAGPLSAEGKALFDAQWQFECTPECTGGTVGGTVGAEDGAQVVGYNALRLEPDTDYEVRLIATNAAGTETVVRNFHTPGIPPGVKTTPGASDGQGGYILEGVVDPNNSRVTDCHFEYGTTATYPNTYSAPCSPSAIGKNEVQRVLVIANGGQFRLSFKGQKTGDLAYNALPAAIESALEGLSTIGANGVSVAEGPPYPFSPSEGRQIDVTFTGPLSATNVEQLAGENGTVPLTAAFFPFISPSTLVQGNSSDPTSVEAHLENLTVGVVYHFKLFATSAAGMVESEDGAFTPTLAQAQDCSNEQLRKEGNSLTLPECRAYEMVSPIGKEGFDAELGQLGAGGNVQFFSGAGNLSKSGQNYVFGNFYVATRTSGGWQTVANLNGADGALYDGSNAPTVPSAPLTYSSDLLTSIWSTNLRNDLPGENTYKRNPDGTFTMVLAGPLNDPGGNLLGVSDDLSHVFVTSTNYNNAFWGLGVYEVSGTGNDEPKRADVDNSGAPITTCIHGTQDGSGYNADSQFNSRDGRVVLVRVWGGCGGANPPADELWARVNGATSFRVSGSQCDRIASDPGGLCNGPADAAYLGATPDGSRIFFTTTQQLLDSDVDQTSDIYACNLPSGNPAPVGTANSCSSLIQVSDAESSARVEAIDQEISGFGHIMKVEGGFSADGSTAMFTANGVLADNEDALGEQALPGDHNLYVWRQDSTHPAGQISFVARLGADDLRSAGGLPQVTPNGRYQIFSTASQLVTTDTDTARDVYRYDADADQLIRVSINIFGTAGNGAFSASITSFNPNVVRRPLRAVSDDGQKVVFRTAEALSPADGNAEPDVYLWTPSRVSLISSGAVGGAVINGNDSNVGGAFAIDESGDNIYFESPSALTPADPDDLGDVYSARINGGFSFVQSGTCAGETCQPQGTGPGPDLALPTTQPPPDGGNRGKPKACPKGKVLKKNKCVKKKKGKKHSKKPSKKAGHKHGGAK